MKDKFTLSLDDWNEEIFLNEFLKKGMVVDDDFYNHLRNSMLPHIDYKNYFQMGTAVDTVKDSKGRHFNTYMTFEKEPDGSGWRFPGQCYHLEKDNRNPDCDINIVAMYKEDECIHVIEQYENSNSGVRYDNYYDFDFVYNSSHQGYTCERFNTLGDAMEEMTKHRPSASLIYLSFGELIRSSIECDNYSVDDKFKEELLEKILNRAFNKTDDSVQAHNGYDEPDITED